MTAYVKCRDCRGTGHARNHLDMFVTCPKCLGERCHIARLDAHGLIKLEPRS